MGESVGQEEGGGYQSGFSVWVCVSRARSDREGLAQVFEVTTSLHTCPWSGWWMQSVEHRIL